MLTYRIQPADKNAQSEAAVSTASELRLVKADKEKQANNPAFPGITGGPGFADNNPFQCEGGSHIENTEVFQSYLLIQNVLYHSWMEIKRTSTRKAEAEFWRSRRADFFVYLLNLHRDLMGMSFIHADCYRRGIAEKLNKPKDWLMPEDGMSDEEVEEFCENYMSRWRSVREAHPNGVGDPAAERMFTPNLPGKASGKPLRDSREPTPICEYRNQRQNARAEEEQLEFPLDVAASSLDDGALALDIEEITVEAGGAQAATTEEAIPETITTKGIVPAVAAPAPEAISASTGIAIEKHRPPGSASSQSHTRSSSAPRITPQDVFGPALEKAARPRSSSELSEAIAANPKPHPAAMLGTHPLYRHDGAEDPKNGRPRLRIRTQWVPSV